MERYCGGMHTLPSASVRSEKETCMTGLARLIRRTTSRPASRPAVVVASRCASLKYAGTWTHMGDMGMQNTTAARKSQVLR